MSTRSNTQATRRKRPASRSVKPAPKEEDGTLSPEDDARTDVLRDLTDLEAMTAGEKLRIQSREAAKEELDREKGLTGPWERVPLGQLMRDIKDGKLPLIEQHVLSMEPSGRCLLYKGLVNGIHGHSNAGKSWTALLACKQELEAGEVTFYIDYEADDRGIAQRLVQLGASPDAVDERFHYYRPTTKFDQKSFGRKMRRYKPSLVVIDAVGGSLAVEGLKFIEDDDITKWAALVSNFIASHGAAVLVLDHLPKDTAPGTLWPTGSQRKRAIITGAQYLQEKGIGFSRSKSGYAKLIAAKDRYGNYGEAEVVAHLKFDVIVRKVKGFDEPQPVTRVALVDPPPKEIADSSRFKKTATDLCKVLEATQPLTRNALVEDSGIQGDKKYKTNVLRQLVDAGFIKAVPRGSAKNSPIDHTLVKPYDGVWTPEERELVDL